MSASNGNGHAAKEPDWWKVEPRSPNSEAALLGCCMLSNDIVSRCEERSVGEAFHDLRHKTIYESMVELIAAGTTVDVVTIQESLMRRGMLGQVGGINYIWKLPDDVPSPASWSFYADIMQEKHTMRRMIGVCRDMVQRVGDFEGDVGDLLSEFEAAALAVRPRRGERKDMKGVLRKVMEKFQGWFADKRSVTGLPTGFADLDKMTSGLQPGELTVIAGFTSAGKTSFACNIADHVALTGAPVGVFSLEMKAERLAARSVASLARVDSSRIRRGDMNQGEFDRLHVAFGALMKTKVFYEDGAGLTGAQCRAKMRRLASESKVQLFVVDYIQLMEGHARRRDENREQEVANIARDLKNGAEETQSHVLALSQVNDDGRLRESRAIGQHADNVLVLEADGEGKDGLCPVVLHVRKQRDGDTGPVKLVFLKKYTRFESASRVGEDNE